MPNLDTLLGIGSMLLVVAFVGRILWRVVRGAPGRAQARSVGVLGVAEILAIERTGLSVNDQPEVKFTLRLSFPDGRTVQAETAEIVDILHLPRIQPGNRIAVQYDPSDPSIVAVRLDVAPQDLPAGNTPATASSEPVSATGAQIGRPLWTYGHGDAIDWMFGRRTDASGGVVVIDFCDPHAESGTQERNWIVDSAAYLVSEAVWTRTDLPAIAAPFVNLENRKLIDPTGTLPDHDDLLPFLRSLDPQPAVVVWGAGELGEEATVKLRVTADGSERTLKVPLAELGDTVIDLLVGKGLCRRVAPPSWYRAPTGKTLSYYALLLHNLQLQVLADAKNGALPELDDEFQHMLVDFALDSLGEFPDAGPQLAVIAVTTALYAARAGKLHADDRERALDLLGRIEAEDHPVFRLSPHWLRVLGEPDLADRRLAQLRSATAPQGPYRADGEYATWLASLPIA